jgi:aminoglycoside phosphotransferase (APT) family kinase protein
MKRSRDLAGHVRRLVAAYMPGYQVDSVIWLGAGLDNTAYEVNSELIVRFSKEPDSADRAEQVSREARLLAAVAEVSPLPVPQPAFTVGEQGCLAYFKIPGMSLLDLPRSQGQAHLVSIGATLGGFLAALHAVPAGRVADLVDRDSRPLEQWRREAADLYATVADAVPVAHRRPVEAFLAAPPPDDGYTPVFSHNDLGIEHVLVNPATWAVTGIVDWSDAALTDPAYDVGLLHRDLGPTAAAAAIRSLQTSAADAAFAERAVFYASCSVLEDLAYGIETGQEKYVGNGLAALGWLFPM